MRLIRLVISTVSSILGYTGFIAFVILKNYPSAALGLISGTTDATLVFLHYLNFKGRLVVWYERTDLRRFCRLGILIGTVGLLSLGYFTTIQILLKKPVFPISESGAIPIVWSIITLRSGILLMYYGITYQNEFPESSTRLL